MAAHTGARRNAGVAAGALGMVLALLALAPAGPGRVALANHVCGHAQAPPCTATPAAPTATRSATPAPPTATGSPTAGSETSTATSTSVAIGSATEAAASPTATQTPTAAPPAQGGQGGRPATETPEPPTATPSRTPTLPPGVTPSATATPIPPGARVLIVSGGAPGSFSATLAGTDQVLYTTLEPFTVDDSTGTADGWHVSVQAAPLTCAAGVDACPAAGDALPAGSLVIAAPTVACAQGTACVNRAAPPS